jgi:hypothetical protein
MIRDAKTSHLCEKIDGADSSRELFRVTFELLCGAGRPELPSSIPLAELPDSFNRFFIDKIEQIRQDMPSHTSQLDTDPIFGSSPFSEFQCVSESYIKDLIVKRPKSHVILTRFLPSCSSTVLMYSSPPLHRS